MHTSTVAVFAVAFLSLLTSALEVDRKVTIHAWPLSASTSKTLAQVTYNSTSATLQTYTPLSLPSSDREGDEIIRVGFYQPSGSWSGIATSASNFDASKEKKLRLHLTAEGELYHIGFTASDVGGSGTGAGAKKDVMAVEVVKVRPGPTPHLDKPVVVSADGKVDAKEPEKSFLQKYWWAIAGFLLLQVVMSGGKGE